MHPYMEQACVFVEFLGNVLGKNCEVVLQDLSDDNCGIVAIKNGHISNRSIGAPATDYALDVMLSGIWKEKNFETNYLGYTADGRPLNSSTLFIKDGDRLLGMICINYDFGEFDKLCNAFRELGGISPCRNSIEETDATAQPVLAASPKKETLAVSIAGVVGQAMDALFPDEPVPPAKRMTREEKVAIIKKLEQRGVFRVKGAISEVANLLSCSEATIYRYLSEIEKY